MATYTHNNSLAVAAIVVSIVAAMTALALMNNIRTLPESRRKAVIVMAAFLLGGGIWSMHFLAMLSIQFPVPIHYDLLQTLGSGLIAVLVVGFALLLLHFRTRTGLILNSAGLCLGVGIIVMHIVGMLGMRGVLPEFNTVALLIALILALVMGVTAVRVSYGERSRQNILKGGFLFGLSVVVVHYTAMVGTEFSVDPDYKQVTIALNQGALAIVVTVAAFVISGTFLLAASTFVQPDDRQSSLVPDKSDRSRIDQADIPVAVPDSAVQNMSLLPSSVHTQPGSAQGRSRVNSAVSELNKAHGKPQGEQAADVAEYAPDASKHHTNEWVRASSTNENDGQADHFLPVKIPYEQQKQIFFIDSIDVGALRADGRYTQLYTRDGVKFCPWSITEAEKRLTGVRFYRSHRSYLINMQAVVSFEKNRDAGVCRFEGFTQLGNVPVSRSRVGELLLELGL